MTEKFIIKRYELCVCGCGATAGMYYSGNEKFENMGNAMTFASYKEAQDNVEVIHSLYGGTATIFYQIDKIFIL